MDFTLHYHPLSSYCHKVGGLKSEVQHLFK